MMISWYNYIIYYNYILVQFFDNIVIISTLVNYNITILYYNLSLHVWSYLGNLYIYTI